MSEIGYKIEELVEIVNQLRGPDGVRWLRSGPDCRSGSG